MRLRFAALIAATLSVAPAQAAPAPAPKLLVAISIDQLSAQLFSQYRPHFTGGLRRLADGIAFADGYQAHGATETCPGHSTILTGRHPASNGIIANDWTDLDAPRADKRVYCAEDERVPGSASEDYFVSAVHLRTPTLGDRMKQADPRSRVVAIGGKDRSAVMLGGRDPDQRWWWDGGKFVQNSSAAPAPVAAQVNAAIAMGIGQARPPLVPPAHCAARDRAIDLGNGRSVGTFRFARAAGDAAAFGSGPEVDAATLALAAAMVQQLQLGRGEARDLLAVSLAATDFVGHRYGPEGLEMCLQLTSLDSDLAGFFTFLDRSGIDYAVVLTADHGGNDLPERQRLNGVADAQRLDPSAGAAVIGSEVARQLGLATPAFVGDWRLTSSVPAARRQEALSLAKQLLMAHPQVHAVHSAEEIAAHPMPTGRPEDWTVLDRLRASFDAERSGDLSVVYEPNVTTISVVKPGGSVATHGTVWDYDRKVPILFWWAGAPREDRRESAMTVDIMPTLASLIRLPVPPGEVDGRCLDLVAGEGTNCP